MAFSRDGAAWFLINASPDIRDQIEALPFRALGDARPRKFEAVLLSNADLDHTLGLMIVREGGPVTTYCTDDVWQTVSGALGFDRILGGFNGGGLRRRKLASAALELDEANGTPTGLTVRTLMLGGEPPRFDPSPPGGAGNACAFVIEEPGSGARFVCALDVPGRSAELLAEIEGASLSLVDGTFWADREMIDLGFSIRTATEMGHWPISGEDGSLSVLRSNGQIVYSHINNTNPMLNPRSRERTQVRSAGVVVGEDGMEWTI